MPSIYRHSPHHRYSPLYIVNRCRPTAVPAILLFCKGEDDQCAILLTFFFVGICMLMIVSSDGYGQVADRWRSTTGGRGRARINVGRADWQKEHGAGAFPALKLDKTDPTSTSQSIKDNQKK
ncbi:hypothetical protein A2U01_0034447, partial [Trifolium medium]|nr:hypothetical protein [Trifolium medium]